MELCDDNLTAIIGLVRKHTGIAMNEHKRVLLQGRLLPRLRALGLNSYRAYIERLATDRVEVASFINSVTTNDTAFFRTPAVWRWLEREFLPHWMAQGEARPLRIWSAAAATGEESGRVGCCSGAVASKYARPRQRIHFFCFALISVFHNSLPVVASTAITLLCGVQRKSLLPICNGVC